VIPIPAHASWIVPIECPELLRAAGAGAEEEADGRTARHRQDPGVDDERDQQELEPARDRRERDHDGADEQGP
jgi:hypothetical protein